MGYIKFNSFPYKQTITVENVCLRFQDRKVHSKMYEPKTTGRDVHELQNGGMNGAEYPVAKSLGFNGHKRQKTLFMSLYKVGSWKLEPCMQLVII